MNEKLKILIIEDDPDFIEATKLILEQKNYQVLSAYDPSDGMKIAKKENPNVIILDVMFGEKSKDDGFDFAYKLRQDKKLAYIPILMLTAVNMEYPGFSFSPKTDGEYLPVDDFIDKPPEADELLQKIEKLLLMKKSKWAK